MQGKRKRVTRIPMKKAPKGVFVVHGEAESAKAFGDYVRGKTGWKVTVPAYEIEIVLD